MQERLHHHHHHRLGIGLNRMGTEMEMEIINVESRVDRVEAEEEEGGAWEIHPSINTSGLFHFNLHSYSTEGS